MPLTALRRADPLLERALRPLKPAKFIVELAKVDRPAYFRNFKGYRIERFGRPAILKISRKELFERENETWAQMLIILWNDANRDIYNAFKDRVQTINEEVEKVEKIEDDIAEQWVEDLLNDFVLEDILLCIYFNGVRFTDAFIRRRLEAPLEIERPADDKMGADEPMPTDEDEDSAKDASAGA
jgi:hypothetical protein